MRTKAKAAENDDRFGRGSLATSGNSHALRIDMAFVRQNPVLARTGLKVRFGKVAADTFVFRVLGDAEQAEQSDPVVEAYLAFLESDLRRHPEALSPMTADEAARLGRLVEGIVVDDDDALSPDTTF